ncbi:DUF3239 domain-containing protein [Corynebacterium yudongzhengii]|uniref:DUF3239 domain-containing protein n=1 Tax=Corynebacterium yudongzhengii TaxID=2080740 RepID=A0A2U1T7S0_9CORY|nr:DUF3239 domain-containing protein [Corynebacterium yudongzhengii]AWB82366.1 DUF3239 domain-containing protein [Corynebacterium yudongzhengii]PWC02015.1 DUF3239 domain-containing protein [Corynebacterium yudongzhengii]
MKVFKFEVDEPFARKHNEMIRDTRRVRAGGILLGAIVIILALLFYFFIADQAVWALMILIVAIAMGIVFAIVGITVARKYNKIQPLYDRYPLVPSVIAEVNERDFVLMALVNTNVDPSLPPRWGLALRTVTAVPGIKTPKIGMKIPSAAVLGRRTTHDRDHWQQITPMPIAWGTPDQDIVKEARRSIPQEQWNRLDRNRDKLNDVKATSQDLLVL